MEIFSVKNWHCWHAFMKLYYKNVCIHAAFCVFYLPQFRDDFQPTHVNRSWLNFYQLYLEFGVLAVYFVWGYYAMVCDRIFWHGNGMHFNTKSFRIDFNRQHHKWLSVCVCASIDELIKIAFCNWPMFKIGAKRVKWLRELNYIGKHRRTAFSLWQKRHAWISALHTNISMILAYTMAYEFFFLSLFTLAQQTREPHTSLLSIKYLYIDLNSMRLKLLFTHF